MTRNQPYTRGAMAPSVDGMLPVRLLLWNSSILRHSVDDGERGQSPTSNA
jgi:hypothetical protein